MPLGDVATSSRLKRLSYPNPCPILRFRPRRVNLPVRRAAHIPEEDGAGRIETIVEHPTPEKVASNLLVHVRCILTSATFDMPETIEAAPAGNCRPPTVLPSCPTGSSDGPAIIQSGTS